MPAAEHILDANVRYHDLVARDYDSKWGIDFGHVGRAQVLGKLDKTLGASPGVYERALEVGAGTGYFTLNLLRAGVVRRAVATDVSAGMLSALRGSAERLGLEVDTALCEAAALPFDDGSFDLVFGHAVLHHLPDLTGSFREFRRVLRPGGVIAFCGEPSLHGDRISALPKRGALAAAPLWRALMGASARSAANGAAPSERERLEREVDVHAFTPCDLESAADAAGFDSVRVSGEELAASIFGWANRTLEATADQSEIPWAWRVYAHRGYLLLQRFDEAILEPRLPAGWFYNLLVSGRAPGAASR